MSDTAYPHFHIYWPNHMLQFLIGQETLITPLHINIFPDHLYILSLVKLLKYPLTFQTITNATQQKTLLNTQCVPITQK